MKSIVQRVLVQCTGIESTSTLKLKFCFVFVKHLPNALQFQQCVLSSLCITYDMDQASFLWCCECSLPRLGHLPIFTPLSVQSHEIFESFFTVKFFAGAIASGTSSIFGGHFPPFCRCACLHWVPLAAWLASPTGAGPPFPCSAVSSPTPYMCCWNFTSSIATLHSFASLSSFLASSLFRWSILVKCHVGFSPGEKEVTQLRALLSVCDLNGRCSVTCHWQTLKGGTWLVIDCDVHLLFL